MTLLDFARGPALQWSLFILVFGVVWRVAGSLLFMLRKDLSKARRRKSVQDGMTVIVTRSLPAHPFEKRIRFQHYSGYAWHITLFIAVLFFAPHILFFKSLLGFGWPGLPNGFILISAAVTLAILLALIIRRATNPVLRTISNADDYISVLVVAIATLTGILSFAHIGGRYETMLAIHLLSVEALFVWFPFGKLMHTALVWPARYQAGAAYGRRGVKA